MVSRPGGRAGFMLVRFQPLTLKTKIMGVMSCNRKNCENIMCDTYISDVGYVCDECQAEFKENLNVEVKNEGEIIRELQKFMATEKFVPGKEMSVDEFFAIRKIDHF